ncbi:MAG: nicotinate (nicotinamide) nucleotide adenylyltransferase [Betaproteobacteria bacterium]|nr:nicotinate (nicotinamide) nucleotide adenylyltransferase [Betaproteobacteria bacterium]
MARIGLLGGSFDPIHLAHLQLASCAAEQLALDQVWLIPAGRPWQRGALGASPEQREQMVRLAAAGQPGLRVLELELRRDGPTYTVDTLRELRAEHPEHEFVLLLGADQLDNFPTWKDWDEIAEHADLAVAPRPGHGPRADPALLRVLHAAGHHLLQVRMPPTDVSATQVRERAARGLGLDPLVPRAVADYIERHHLYQSPTHPNGHS